MQKIFEVVCNFCATTFGTGYLGRGGKFGGTIGSLVALVIQAYLYYIYGSTPWFYLWAAIGTFILGLLVIGPAEKFMFDACGPGKKHNGKSVTHDRNQTNLDEVHGMFITNLPLVICNSSSVPYLELFIGFCVFRIFDILKPWPVSWADKKETVPFSWMASVMIMLDDTLAGVISATVMVVVHWVVVS